MEALAGEEFTQILGGTFRYRVSGATLKPDRTNRSISRSQFEQAYQLVPFPNTSVLHQLQGPSYIYAIMMDPRVSQGNW